MLLFFFVMWRWKHQIRSSVKSKQSEVRGLEESLDSLDSAINKMKDDHVKRIDGESAKFHSNMDKLHKDTQKLIQNYREQMEDQHKRRVEYHEQIDKLKREIIYLNGILTSLQYENETKALEFDHDAEQKKIDDAGRAHEHELLRVGREKDVERARVQQAVVQRVADDLEDKSEKVDEQIKKQFAPKDTE